MAFAVITMAALSLFLVFVFTKQIQILVNKIMSRDYQSFVMAEKPSPTQIRLPLEPSPEEDLGRLNDFLPTM